MSKKLPCSFLSQGLNRDFGLSCLDLEIGVILCWMARIITLHGKYIMGMKVPDTMSELGWVGVLFSFCLVTLRQ